MYLRFRFSGSPSLTTRVETIPHTEVRWDLETEHSIHKSFGTVARACNLLSCSPIILDQPRNALTIYRYPATFWFHLHASKRSTELWIP